MKLAILKPHRTWLGVLAAAVALLFLAPPLTDFGLEKVTTRARELAAERNELQESIARFNDDMRLAERQDGALSGKAVDRLLSPVDRLRVVAAVEQQAAASRLSHFTYTLQAEKKAKGVAVEMDNLAVCDVTLAADAPLDTDVYAFIKSLSTTFPGRVRVRQLVLSRTPEDVPLTLANIHMEAVLEWLSNGSAQEQGRGL